MAQAPLPLKDTTRTSAAVDITPFPGGVIARARRHEVTLRAWEIDYRAAPEAWAADYIEHFASVGGQGGSFSWTPPGEVASITVRYASDLTVTRHPGDNVNITFRIQELRS